MFVVTRMLSSRTAVLCALYGVGGDLSFLHFRFACCVAHTQPHSVCPVPSVELPCLYIYNIRLVTSGHTNVQQLHTCTPKLGGKCVRRCGNWGVSGCGGAATRA
eukprot:jgi/Chrzof1/3478/Cz12g26300.t1